MRNNYPESSGSDWNSEFAVPIGAIIKERLLETDEEEVADHLILLGEEKDHEVMIEAAYVIPGPLWWTGSSSPLVRSTWLL